jgi:AraC-like DNA-binding protein
MIARLIVELAGPHFLHLRRAATGAASHAARHVSLVQAARCKVAVERSLPDAGLDLCFNLGPSGRQLVSEGAPRALSPRAAWVIGPHARSLLIEKEIADCDIIGVHLRPGAASQILGVPASELRNALVDLDVMWGRPIVEAIRERLRSATDALERLAIVERVIAERWARARHSPDAALARRLCGAVSTMGHASVATVARAHGLSHRRVIALFDRHVGLKPKAFHRIDRLRRVMNRVQDERRVSWTKLANSSGYFDQAHLINDFRLQTGLTPSEYAATRSAVGVGFVPHTLASNR